ncbi:MAG: hypothetical protein JNJ54_36065 [Myxococcaceae bacterium]|nr:hypothetical protein [Myxococcaceae bacterium]
MQATQGPVQLEAQQTPSTQLPVEHSQLAAQVAPLFFFAVQAVPEQYAAALSHCVLAQPPVHEVLHAGALVEPLQP